MKTNGYICNFCKRYRDMDEDKSVSFFAYDENVTIDLCHDCAERLLQLLFTNKENISVLDIEGIIEN